MNDQQKRWLMIGAPIVGVFALIVVLQRRKSPTPATSGTIAGGGVPTGSGNVVDVGTLASWQASTQQEISQLSAGIAAELAAFQPSLPNGSAGLTPTPQPSPAPTVAVASSPAAAPSPFTPPPGGQVSFSDPNVPTWYKYGFPSQAAYDAAYNSPPTISSGWARRL